MNLKIKTMKSLILLSIFSLSFLFIKAQDVWSEEIPLTDSSSINTRAVVLLKPNETFMFYEKKNSDGDPSSIYYRDIQNMSEEIPLLSDKRKFFP